MKILLKIGRALVVINVGFVVVFALGMIGYLIYDNSFCGGDAIVNPVTYRWLRTGVLYCAFLAVVAFVVVSIKTFTDFDFFNKEF